MGRYEPLKDPELKSKIDALASRVSFPLTHVYVMDGSRRSAHSNAFFYGFFKNKRIVLFDTLLTQVRVGCKSRTGDTGPIPALHAMQRCPLPLSNG